MPAIREVRIPSSWDELGKHGCPSNRAGKFDDFVIARYQIVEVLKGDPDPHGVVISPFYGPGNCELALFPGLYFVIFADEFQLTGICHGKTHLGWDPQQDIVKKEFSTCREGRETTELAE